MSWKEFFAPTRTKVIIAILIPIIFALLGVVSYFTQIELNKPAIESGYLIPIYSSTTPIFSFQNIIYFVINYSLFALLSYPFSCSIVILWNRFVKKNIKKLEGSFLVLTLIGIFVFNPISVRIISSIFSYLYVVNTITPCGVTYKGFVAGSPAMNSGLPPSTGITKLNNYPIHSLQDFSQFINNTKPGDNVTINTQDNRSFEVTLAKSPNGNYGFLGLTYVETAYCKK